MNKVNETIKLQWKTVFMMILFNVVTALLYASMKLCSVSNNSLNESVYPGTTYINPYFYLFIIGLFIILYTIFFNKIIKPFMFESFKTNMILGLISVFIFIAFIVLEFVIVIVTSIFVLSFKHIDFGFLSNGILSLVHCIPAIYVILFSFISIIVSLAKKSI